MISTPSSLVIFSGGKGTRLGSVGSGCPKAAIDINGAPLVSYLIAWAKKEGFKRTILASGHLHNVLLEKLEDHYNTPFKQLDSSTYHSELDSDFEVILRNTGLDSQTAQRLFFVRDLLKDQALFVVTYADTLTDMHVASPLKIADENNSLICLTAGYPDARYGELLMQGDLVVSFKEKARPKFRINRGFLVIKQEIFSRWDKKKFISLEEHVLPHFSALGEVVAFKSEDWFFSVDSEVDASELELLLSSTERE